MQSTWLTRRYFGQYHGTMDFCIETLPPKLSVLNIMSLINKNVFQCTLTICLNCSIPLKFKKYIFPPPMKMKNNLNSVLVTN